MKWVSLLSDLKKGDFLKVYVTDSSNNRVCVFDTHGGFKFAFGDEGFQAGQFKLPRGIAIDQKVILWTSFKLLDDPNFKSINPKFVTWFFSREFIKPFQVRKKASWWDGIEHSHLFSNREIARYHNTTETHCCSMQ